jgi:toxin ParE1/3/4
MKYNVYIIADAEEDLYEIFKYVSTNDSPNKAEALITNMEKACINLGAFPDRGHTPPELERIGVYDYQEIHYKTDRIIYQAIRNTVYVHCILDSRRDLQEILEKRLLR